MKIGDLFYETWHALSANKGRSFLTILGIVIGIAAVIAMTSLIAGVQNMLMGEMGLSQARQVSISAYSPQGITFDDLDKLEQGMPEYEVITGASYASAEITMADGQKNHATVIGARPDYFTANGTKLKEGRFFTESEEQNAARLVVMGGGEMTVQMLGVPDTEAVGKTVRLGNDDYTVIGVLETSSFMEGRSTRLTPRWRRASAMRAASNRSSASRARAPTWIGSSRRRRPLWRSTSIWSPRTCTCRRSTPSSSRWKR